MAIGDVITVKINEVVSSGDGLARFGSTAVFVNRSCAGETVEVRIFDEKPTWLRAEIIKVVGKVSLDRVKPRCPFFGVCGGCTMQHLQYDAQLDAKVARFNDRFKHIAGFHPPELRVVASEPWEYKNYMRFLIRREARSGTRSAVELGFVNFRGNDFVPVSDCPIADPAIRSMLARVAETRALVLPGHTEEYIVYSGGGLFLTDMGTREGTINILDRDFVVDVNAYIPSNIPVMEQLIADLIDIADSADHSKPMADLYCGIGTFSAFLADSFPSADLMDENRQALRLARINIPAKNARFYEVKDRHWVSELQPEPGSYGFMVVDPPSNGNSRGLPSSVSAWIAKGGPPVVAYRSQDAGAFAGDTAVLCRAGYRLARVTMYDLHPHTGFTDTLAVFTR